MSRRLRRPVLSCRSVVCAQEGRRRRCVLYRAEASCSALSAMTPYLARSRPEHRSVIVTAADVASAASRHVTSRHVICIIHAATKNSRGFLSGESAGAARALRPTPRDGRRGSRPPLAARLCSAAQEASCSRRVAESAPQWPRAAATISHVMITRNGPDAAGCHQRRTNGRRRAPSSNGRKAVTTGEKGHADK